MHKGIQNHSLQFPPKLSIRKMKPWFQIFKYSLLSVGWSHKSSTCCVNSGVTVENGYGSTNRMATQQNQAMSKQKGKRKKSPVCCLPWKIILMSPWRSFDWSLFSTAYVLMLVSERKTLKVQYKTPRSSFKSNIFWILKYQTPNYTQTGFKGKVSFIANCVVLVEFWQ